jgi:hypothetical protein
VDIGPELEQDFEDISLETTSFTGYQTKNKRKNSNGA